MTMDGAVIGTPAYMSPEQARGEIAAVDTRSDVYAMGTILYELLTGLPPYAKTDETQPPRLVLEAVLNGPPSPIRELSTVPAELEAICERAMARRPSDRYGDVVELADDLRAFLEHRVVSAYETGAVAELRKWVVRNRGLAASLAAVFVLLLASGSIFGWMSGRNIHALLERERTAIPAGRDEHLGPVGQDPRQ
jgi:hypothetical protein